MNIADLICKKRDGKALADDEIREFIKRYTKAEIPDYQVSALAMAIYFKGMTEEEVVVLTDAMVESGDRIPWSQGLPLVDKHSSGGVGDKVSLPLAPLLACCGVRVPMISGRGLGITGGTLDKLDAIPGFRSDLSVDEFRSVVNWNGCAISGATPTLAPADRKLYALRDVTGTVPSIPLITASILSKKLAEGVETLVLDVKWGTGAFMKTVDQAKELARSLVRVGSQLGLQISALITDMNQPLGHKIGNVLEVQESIAMLNGDGPADLKELTFRLGQSLLCTAGVADSPEEAQIKMEHAIKHKMAAEKFAEMVDGQGGKLSQLPKPEFEHPLAAPRSGYVQSIQTERLGLAVIEMGGGRKKMGDSINYRVGLELHKKMGDSVESGERLATVYCDGPEWKYASELVLAAFAIADPPCEPPVLITDEIEM